MIHYGRFLLAGACAAILGAGCHAEPKSWQGELKFLNVHAVAFTPQGRGLVMVGPRSDDADARNGSTYYYLDLPTMTGRRLGYGQYALGQALLCPFEDWVAVPAYLGDPDGPTVHRGYEIYNLAAGNSIRAVAIDKPEMFVGHVQTVSSQPEEAAVSVWQKISANPLTSLQLAAVRDFHPLWITRGSRNAHGRQSVGLEVKTQTVDGQTFYVLDSPDGKHRLYLRFNAPSGNAAKAADPDSEGYAYGYLAEIKTGKRYMLYTTSGADETLDDIGSAVIAGPVWLAKQPSKWFGGK